PADAGPTAASSLDVKKVAIYTACLLASSFTLWLSERAQHRGDGAGPSRWLGLTLLLGLIFIVGQAREYIALYASGVTMSRNLFATTFFTLTGFHGLHVTVGLVALAIVLGRALAGDFVRRPASRILNNVGLYWHFVDGGGLVLSPVVYLGTLGRRSFPPPVRGPGICSRPRSPPPGGRFPPGPPPLCRGSPPPAGRSPPSCSPSPR